MINLKRQAIKGLFKKGKRVLNEEGLLILSKRILFAYSVVDLWENNLNGSIIACKVDNLTLKIITELEEFDEVLSYGFDLSWYEMSIQQCRERLSKGSILFLTLVGREIAHISWVGTTKRTHDDFYSSPIDYKHEASIGGTMTAPKHREKGIYTWVYSQMFQYLIEKGYSRALFEIHKDNVVAHKAQAKLGSYVLGTGHRLRLLLLFNFKWLVPIVESTHRMRGCDR